MTRRASDVQRTGEGQAPLFDEHAHARRTDPLESHLAAERATPHLTDVQDRVLIALRMRGPATDDEIEARFRRYWPELKVSPQSIRSRRAELVKKGYIRQADRYGVTDYGNRARVWEVT